MSYLPHLAVLLALSCLATSTYGHPHHNGDGGKHHHDHDHHNRVDHHEDHKKHREHQHHHRHDESQPVEEQQQQQHPDFPSIDDKIPAHKVPELQARVDNFKLGAGQQEFVYANTTNGPLFGYRNRFGGASFRGVPFADPPVGNLRFAPTQPISQNWTEPRNATVFGAGCISHCSGHLADLMCARTISEDCLYLNVYTPAVPQDGDASSAPPSGGYPVYFFIHGGMFTWGSGGIPLYDGGQWSTLHNIIVVTINYRLNIFGSLFTGTTAVNSMLTDQRMALKWVHDNIHFFGGNNKKVVLSGQSAGASSVGMHMVSPGSYPYFQRAAIISNPYGLIPPSKKMAQELGTVVLIKLGCPIGGEAELACLRNVSVDKMFAMSKTDFLPTPNEVLAMFLQWSPFVDGEILPMQPIQAMELGQFHRVPLMIGTVANETIPFIFGIDAAPEWLASVALDVIFGLKHGPEIMALYLKESGPPANVKDVRPFFSRIFTDYSFYCPTHYVAAQHAAWMKKSTPVPSTYVWFFDEHPSWALWYANGNAKDPCVEYICHAFDLPTWFNSTYELPAGFPQFNAGEESMVALVQDSVAEFSRHGSLNNTKWAPFSNESRVMMNISYPLPTLRLDAYRRDFCAYFDSIGYNRW